MMATRLHRRLGFLHVMRRVENGAAGLGQSLDAGQEMIARLRIDACCRLVEEENLGIVHHGAGEIQPPFHAARIAFDAIAPGDR